MMKKEHKIKTINYNLIKILVNSKHLFIVENKNINVGILNNDLLFIPIYIFSYKSNTKLESDKYDLMNDSIEKYIKSRNCSETIYDIQKIMKRGEHIGDFQIVHDIEHKKNLPLANE